MEHIYTSISSCYFISISVISSVTTDEVEWFLGIAYIITKSNLLRPHYDAEQLHIGLNNLGKENVIILWNYWQF